MFGEPEVTRSEGNRLWELGIPSVAIFLDGGIRRVPLPTVTAGTEVRRHTAPILGRR
jgi:hypothetical protein